jgi:hypothetical protein
VSRRAIPLAILLSAQGIASGLPAQAGAANPAVPTDPPIEGVFLLDPEAGDSVEDVIDRGVGLLPWYKRPFARGRLRDGTLPAHWVSIEPGPRALRIRTEIDDLTIPWDGGLRGWEWKEDDPVDVTASWDGADLLQNFHGTDGSRYNRYVLSADGQTLDLLVRVEADQLAEPLRYRLVYLRRP